jgi:hypothetical protein
MNSGQDDEPARARARENLAARMRARIEHARASGLSPEQIEEQMAAGARDEVRRQLPELTKQVGSWWSGFRRFLIVGALAFGLAAGLALLVERRYAAPLCERYAAAHGLVYKGLEYPVIGSSSSTTSPSGRCILVNASGRRDTLSLTALEPSTLIALLISLALQIKFTIPASFVLIALLWVGLRKLAGTERAA